MSTEFPVISSEVIRGKETTQIWHLKNWRNELSLLSSTASCPLIVDRGLSRGFRLRFYFQDYLVSSHYGNPLQYLSLLADYSGSNVPDQYKLAQCDFKVAVVDEKFDEVEGGGYFEGSISMTGTDGKTKSKLVLKEKFMLRKPTPNIIPTDELWIKMSVMPTFIRTY